MSKPSPRAPAASVALYVAVPAGLLKKTRELAKYFDASWRYASALRAKPTTKKKSAARKKTPRKT